MFEYNVMCNLPQYFKNALYGFNDVSNDYFRVWCCLKEQDISFYFGHVALLSCQGPHIGLCIYVKLGITYKNMYNDLCMYFLYFTFTFDGL